LVVAVVAVLQLLLAYLVAQVVALPEPAIQTVALEPLGRDLPVEKVQLLRLMESWGPVVAVELVRLAAMATSTVMRTSLF
jgi:hypothetical protein